MTETTAAGRRTFLKMVAGGALGASTSGVVANTVAQEGYAGKLVFTYDDGVIEDYTRAYKQAHEPEGVPACTAMVSARVGSSQSLSESQLRELQDAGWEIMSHTVTHRALMDIPVIRDVEPGDERICVSWNDHGKIAGDTLRLSDGSKSEVVTVSGRDTHDGEPCITLEEGVNNAFAAGETVERHTDDILRIALGGSRSALEEYGLAVTNVVMPYGAYGERTQELVSNHYTAVANAGVGNADEVSGDENGLNPVDNFNLPHLSRRYFREGEMTFDEIADFLDRVVEEDVLGIFGGHTWWNRRERDRLPPERIRETIQMAKDRNIEIVTLQQALDDLGYTDDPTETTTTEQPTTTETTATVDPTTTETATTTGETTTESTTSTTTEATTATTTSTTTESATTTETMTTKTTATTTTTNSTTTTDRPTETTTTESTTETETTATETTTDDGLPNTTMDPPATDTTTKDDGSGGGGGNGGGSSGGSDATTTTATTTTATTTTATTTDELPHTSLEPPTTMALADETSTTTETRTPDETPTTESPAPTETTQGTGNPGVEVPGFGWIATFGAAGSLAAYALSQRDGDDEE